MPETVVNPALQPATPANQELTGWSWGAFMLGPTFLIAVKKYVYLLFYLVYFIPFLNVFALLGIAIFLGIKGRELTYASSMFEKQDEANGFIKAVDHAGKIMFVVSIIFFIIMIIFFIIGFSSIFSNLPGMGNHNQFNKPYMPSYPTGYLNK